MSNPSDHAIRPLLFFPILAALVIVVVVGVIRIVPERSRPPEAVEEAPPPTPHETAVETADEGEPPAGETSPAAAETDHPAPPPPESAAPPATPDQEDAPADESAEEPEPERGGEQAAERNAEETNMEFCEAQGWRLGPVRIATSIFGFRTVRTDGPRYAVAAPLDQRYLSLTVGFIRSSGETTGAIVIAPHDGTSSTLTLSGGGEHYDPVGIVRSDARPWAPFDTSGVSVESGSTAELTLAYLVPSALSRVAVALEGSSCGELELPADERLAIHDLVGYWVKSPEMISSLRYENPIADAVAIHEGLLLRFEPAGVDTVRATFPGPGIASTPLERSPQAFSGAFALQWGEHTTPAWVRTTDGGRRVLLYIGKPGGPAIMFEPAE